MDFNFKVIRNYFDSGTINAMHDEIDDMIHKLPLRNNPDIFLEDDDIKYVKQIQYLNQKSRYFDKVEKMCRGIADDHLGNDNYHVLNMQLFDKHPQVSKPTRSHQDNAYFRLNDGKAITVWIALNDIDEENGALAYYQHKQDQTLPHTRYSKKTTFRIRSGVPGLSLCLHDYPEENNKPKIVKAGDVLIHPANTIHSAGKNNSMDRQRRAIGIVYVANDAKNDPELVEYYNKLLEEDKKIKNII